MVEVDAIVDTITGFLGHFSKSNNILCCHRLFSTPIPLTDLCYIQVGLSQPWVVKKVHTSCGFRPLNAPKLKNDIGCMGNTHGN